MEKYNGIKFKVVYVSGVEPSPSPLLKLDKDISKFIKTKENEGNLSIRAGEGILISAAGSKLTKLKDAIYVKNVVRNRVFVFRGIPSSETIMHWKIYKKRKDVNIIFHFHDDKLLLKDFENEVEHYDYGTLELAEEVGKASEKGDIIKLRKHGFVVLAKNRNDLIKKLERLLK